jgi:large subunit ribosomal protein L31e
LARGKTKEETKTKPEKKKTKPKAKPPAKAKTSKKKEEAKAVEEFERVEQVEEARPEPVKAELEVPSPAEEAKEVVREEVEELKEEAEVEEVKEETKPEKAAEEEEELEIVEEKFYDLNLRRIWTAPREKRTPRAVRFLREFVARRMKTDDVAISEAANSMLWARGISKPPRKIRVRAVKDKEGRVIVFPGEGK